jgi:rhamnogalacturonan endolyase
VKESAAPDRWTLWSTDTDADKKWSGGVVLRAPVTQADRGSPEDGAPPLHTVIRDVPAGTYAVELKVARVLGVSLDGTEWRRFSGGLLIPSARIEAGGTLEFWVDDRYAMEKAAEQGSGYYDYVELTRLRTWVDGLPNPGFEEVTDTGLPADWAWWSRDGEGGAQVVTEGAHGGARAVRLHYPGEQDWAFTNGARLAVPVGTDLCISGWVKGPPGGKRVSIDVSAWGQGKLVTWTLGIARPKLNGAWNQAKGYFQVPEGVDTLQVRLTGSSADVQVDDIALAAGKQVFPDKPRVAGWARERPLEPMGRGAVALPLPDGTVRLSWRLLAQDPPDVGFTVFRRVGDGPPERLNQAPITVTTDFRDAQPPAGARPMYSVQRSDGAGPAAEAVWAEAAGPTPYVRLKLRDASTRFQKAAIVDLNGDGAYDLVIKQPHENIDPWEKYWYKSPETYTLDAYLSDGTFLWSQDLGWAIERGIWYSPYIAWDLTGDGRAEVAAKVGEGDPRDADGRVTSGAEFVVVWDGLTGREIARAPWPERAAFDTYNFASRNQIAVAFLDGKTPCLLTLRGTYTRMLVHAWQLRAGQLEKLWEYDNEEFGARYWGQGAHFTLAADVDGDGRDEVLLGSAVLDDNGVPLWSTGRGHPDAFYLSDITPRNEGLEIAYVMETAQRSGGGLNVADARSGKTLWALDTPTRHVHGKGMCADIDPTLPGLEVYGADADGHTLTENRWLFAADGTLLRSGTDCPWGFDINPLFWDGDLQKELVTGKVTDYQGGPVGGVLQGSHVLTADILGDWREEVIASVAGELRIYCTPIAAADRRVCLMQDPVYRMGTAMNAMGYTQPATLSYNPELRSPGLNLTALADTGDEPTVRVVVSAPQGAGVAGQLALHASSGLQVDPAAFAVRVEAGERQILLARLSSTGRDRAQGQVEAHLTMDGGGTLRGEVPVVLAAPFITDGILLQAEAFGSQEGGEVKIRDDKPGVSEKAISHWDAAGHALTWVVQVPQAGIYRLVLRYCAPHDVTRAVQVDGRPLGSILLPGTGGFGTSTFEWEHATAGTPGEPLRLELTQGEHRIRLENADGKGCNLDYLAFLPMP